MTRMCIDLFSMSVYGGILILVVLFVRMLLKNKLPKQTFPVLWCVALLRLLLPFSVPSSLSVYSMVQRQTAALQEREPDGGADFMTALPSAFYMEGTDFGEAYGYSANDSGSFDGGKDGAGIGSGSKPAEGGLFYGLQKLSLLQRAALGGTVVCAAFFLMLYLNCLRMFGTALPLENRFAEQWMSRNRLLRRVRVRQSDRISSPLTYGIFRPVILLPKQMEREGGQKLEYILQHELVHIRRFDGVWKLVLAAALCLHWFNPLVWAMYVFMNRDLELACDEEVLHTFGAEARKDYALTLLGMEERRYSPVSLYSGFGKNAVEERVGEIMKYKKRTKAAIGMGAALILAVTCMFATSAKAGEGDNTFGDESPLAEEGSLQDTTLTDPPVGYGGDAKVQNTGTDSNSGNDTLIPDAGNAGAASEEPVLFPGMSYAAGEDDNFSMVYTLEGMVVSEPAWLEYGPGYCVLIPKEGWSMSAPGEWVCDINEDVVFRVVHFSGEDSEYRGLSRDQIAESFMEQGYQTQYQDYQLYKEENDIKTVVEIRSNGADNWGVVYTFPSEAEEGFGVTMRVMARHFGIIPMESAENPESAKTPESTGNPGTAGITESAGERRTDSLAVTLTVMEFALECVRGDESAVSSRLSESCQWDAYVMGMLTEWRLEELSVRLHPGGDAAVASIPVRTVESDDSQDYLTIELAKEGEEWKITFIGLEK